MVLADFLRGCIVHRPDRRMVHDAQRAGQGPRNRKDGRDRRGHPRGCDGLHQAAVQDDSVDGGSAGRGDLCDLYRDHQ